MGLGAYPDVTLQRARQKAQEARQQLADGVDPLTAKRSQRASLSQRRAAQAKSLTFDQAADQYIASHRAGWRSIRHAKQWGRSLELYVSPIIGSLSVAEIDTSLVMRVLEPIWLRTPELATHVRQRVEAILDWATVREYRQGANPARWRGHLDKLLPSKAKVAPVVHHRSLPYDQVAAFLTTLRQREAMAARALEFIILTAARAGEVLGMTWGEVDFATKVWTVPASRMKAGREHRVPLSPAAVALLEKLPREGNYVFTGGNRPRLSPMAIKMLLIRMNRRDFVTHGFRSSFRDWAAERTAYPSEVAEMALAHRVGNAVELAYRRTDMFERRRRLMADWAAFCETPASNAEVVPLRA
jgi:integrase